jgi:hypothetical protein
MIEVCFFSRRTAARLTSGDLDTLESEYIKNLQQQIYFLELEVNYLREQVNTKKPPSPATPGTQVEKWTQEIRVSRHLIVAPSIFRINVVYIGFRD